MIYIYICNYIYTYIRNVYMYNVINYVSALGRSQQQQQQRQRQQQQQSYMGSVCEGKCG